MTSTVAKEDLDPLMPDLEQLQAYADGKVAEDDLPTSKPVVFGELTLVFGWKRPEGYLDLVPGGNLASDGSWCGTYVKSTNAEKEMVKPPLRFEKVGSTDWGMALWRMVPPDGYRALTDLIVSLGQDPNKLEGFKRFGCIKDNAVDGFRYVHPADPVKGKGANIWYCRAPKYANGANGVRLGPRMGGGVVYSKDQPEGLPAQYVLNLPVNRRTGANPSKPEMNSYDEPIALTEWAEDNRITVPCLSADDSGHTLKWQVENSPTYTLRRRVAYRLISYLNNETNIDQSTRKSVTEGISKSKTDTFRMSVGYSVSAEAGVNFLGTGGKVSSTTSIEMGYEAQWNVTSMVSETHEEELKVPPKHAGALYGIAHELALHRADGSVAGTGEKLGFEARRAYLTLQYPHTREGEPSAVTHADVTASS